KTGTAQWSTTKPPHAWFTAFAPFQNPEISFTVIVEEGEEGSRISLDIAREFMMWYFSRQP
ncbi:MAG: penicillin-binding transpeptidase domain-containing protein, partial [Patescibacteria group bacterium]